MLVDEMFLSDVHYIPPRPDIVRGIIYNADCFCPDSAIQLDVIS